MTLLLRLAIASALLFTVSLVPAYAANRTPGTVRTHTETVHDRTPTVHVRSSHPHHG
jgi:hypothetical protein